MREVHEKLEKPEMEKSDIENPAQYETANQKWRKSSTNKAFISDESQKKKVSKINTPVD